MKPVHVPTTSVPAADKTPDHYHPLTNPDAVRHSHSVGELLLLNGHYEESIDHLIADLDRPNFARYMTLTNLGIAYRYIGCYQAANNAFARALMEHPESAATWHNLSLLATDMGELDAAFRAADNAYRLWPENPSIRHSLGSALLREGRWKEGWPLWDSGRWCSPRTLGLTLPEWTLGQPLQGKRILILMDGGYGDTFLFLRYSKLLQEGGAHVTIVCPQSQLSLLYLHPYANRWVSDDGTQLSQSDFDYFIPGMSLPAAFASTPSTVPFPDAHLLVDFPDCHTAGATRIGICWKAGEGAHTRKFRSYLPSQLDALRDLSGFEWQSLVPNATLDWTHPLESRDWLETAAVISTLDLVISVDTAIGHLACLMGKPTHLLLHAGADWKWLRHHPTSVWWSSARLWRSDTPDDFLTLPAQLARELR